MGLAAPHAGGRAPPSEVLHVHIDVGLARGVHDEELHVLKHDHRGLVVPIQLIHG